MKLSNKRKPLLFLGARQVGKTYLLKFGETEYKQFAYINSNILMLQRGYLIQILTSTEL